MRERVLHTGAGGLADYEVLEMLLFAGVPRRDTKPLAKSLINRFGGLAAVVSASPDALEQARVPAGCVRLFATLHHIAHHAAQGGGGERLALDNWESMLAYCDVHLSDCAGQMHALFLDSHNHLIADEDMTFPPDLLDSRPEIGTVKQAVARLLQRALALHATGVMTVYLARAQEPLDPAMARDTSFAKALARAGVLLGVAVHGHMVVGQGQWRSFSFDEAAR
ncbi:MAG: JAB domain-containing protein [Acetobacter sp.]|uniref:JAB domain-containing protein n=1 Tax=Acetobacter sp. TaxID=440 RepID=UPI0039E958EC